MKKRVFFILSVFVLSLLASCDEAVMPKATATLEYQTWIVTKSTGLYREPDADSEMIRELPVGTKVRDSGGRDHLENCFFTEGIQVCKVVVVGSSLSGYVILKWLDKD